MVEETRLRALKVLAMDIDGVLTDGGITMGPAGEISKRFDAKDGLGVSAAQRLGLTIVFITGRQSAILRMRASELKITEVYDGVKDKGSVLKSVAEKQGVSLEEVGFIGDDLIDLPALNLAGVAFAPGDASPDVCARVDYVAHHNGGHGAVREIVEVILEAKGLWAQVVADYETVGQGDRQ